MLQPASYHTVELAEAKLTLREDIAFTLQEYGGRPCYVVEDKTNSRFYRVGRAEYTFLSLLDGDTSINAALQLTAQQLGPDAFTENDAWGICKWLIECQLANTNASLNVEQFLKKDEEKKWQARTLLLNPLVIRWPLGNPQPLLDIVSPWMSWTMSRMFLLIWLAMIALACQQLGVNWQRLRETTTVVLAPGNWLFLAVTWLGLKLNHELCHALACRKFGGNVRKAGIVFILGMPLPYVDLTSAWRFPNKWQRIATSAAGMYGDLFLGAAAALIWCHTDSGQLHTLALNTMVFASLTTVLFNANFLMRFDGYYILVDLLEIPNLYSLGQQYVSYLGRRYLLGIQASLPQWSVGKGLVIRLYGIAALVWRVVVCVCLVLATGQLFHGAGLVLAALATLLWGGLPVLRFGKYLAQGNAREKPEVKRFVVVSLSCGCALVLLLTLLPSPERLRVPVIVDYAHPAVVRTESAGFVQVLHVGRDEHVLAGAVLAELENPQLRLELAGLQVDLQQSRLRCRIYHQQGDLPKLQEEELVHQALEERANQRQQQVDNLIVRAPVEGDVLADDLQSLAGRYLAQGNELMMVVDRDHKQLRLWIHQDNIDQFRSLPDATLNVRLRDGTSIRLACEPISIDPRASRQLRDLALGASAGGPLTVEPLKSSSAEWQLLEPGFQAELTLDSQDGRNLRAGQTGFATMAAKKGNLGSYLFRRVREWLRKRTGGYTTACSWPEASKESRSIAVSRTDAILPHETSSPHRA